MLIKAADMMIARRADTKARADFATWKMMAKLNGASALPDEAKPSWRAIRRCSRTCRSRRRRRPPSSSFTEAITAKWAAPAYRPTSRPQASDPVTDNVTAFRRPPAPQPKPVRGSNAKPRLPVALIFACLVVVYAGIRYFLQ